MIAPIVASFVVILQMCSGGRSSKGKELVPIECKFVDEQGHKHAFKAEIQFSKRTIIVLPKDYKTNFTGIISKELNGSKRFSVLLDSTSGWIPVHGLKVKDQGTDTSTPNVSRLTQSAAKIVQWPTSRLELSYILLCENAEYFIQIGHFRLLAKGKFKFTEAGIFSEGQFEVPVDTKVGTEVGTALMSLNGVILVEPRESALHSNWFQFQSDAITWADCTTVTLKFKRIEDMPKETAGGELTPCVCHSIVLLDQHGVPLPYVAMGVDLIEKVLKIPNVGYNVAIFKQLPVYIKQAMNLGTNYDLNYKCALKILARVGSDGGHVTWNKVLGVGESTVERDEGELYSRPCTVLKISFFNLGKPYATCPLKYTIDFWGKKLLTAEIDWNRKLMQFSDNTDWTLKTRRKANMSLQAHRMSGSKPDPHINHNKQFTLRGLHGWGVKSEFMTDGTETKSVTVKFETCTANPKKWNCRLIRISGRTTLYGVRTSSSNEPGDLGRLTWEKEQPWCQYDRHASKELVLRLNFLSTKFPEFPGLLVSDPLPDHSSFDQAGNNVQLVWTPYTVKPVIPQGELEVVESLTIVPVQRFGSVKQHPLHEIRFPADTELKSMIGTRTVDEQKTMLTTFNISLISYFYTNVDEIEEERWRGTELLRLKQVAGTSRGLIIGAEERSEKRIQATKGSKYLTDFPLIGTRLETNDYQQVVQYSGEIYGGATATTALGSWKRLAVNKANGDKKVNGAPVLIIVCNNTEIEETVKEIEIRVEHNKKLKKEFAERLKGIIDKEPSEAKALSIKLDAIEKVLSVDETRLAQIKEAEEGVKDSNSTVLGNEPDARSGEGQNSQMIQGPTTVSMDKPAKPSRPTRTAKELPVQNVSPELQNSLVTNHVLPATPGQPPTPTSGNVEESSDTSSPALLLQNPNPGENVIDTTKLNGRDNKGPLHPVLPRQRLDEPPTLNSKSDNKLIPPLVPPQSQGFLKPKGSTRLPSPLLNSARSIGHQRRINPVSIAA